MRPEHALALVQRFTRHIAERNDGCFRGQPPVFPITLHVLEREWIRALDAGAVPAFDSDTQEECVRVLLDASREVNGLREAHPALTRSPLLLPPSLKAEERLRVLWFHHLEQQGLSWAAKLELGRSQRMFAEIWPALLAAGRVNLVSSEATAFLSTRYALLLAFGLWHANGTVLDVRELFKASDLSEAALSAMLDATAIPLEGVQETFSTAALYPESIQNYFQRYPVIRVGQWAAFAPLPDLLLQSWDLRNLFDNLELTVANQPSDRGGVEFYRALGVVFEAYARELVEELGRESGMSFIPEFRYDGNLDSPDAFLAAGGTVLTFEMKCYRVPRAAYEKVELSSFESWFASLLGKNDKGRPPLVQGESFFHSWKSGNAEIGKKLGAAPKHLRYFVVSYEDVPAFCSWSIFRNWYADKHLSASTRPLWGQTTVLSVRELESLVGAARAHRQRTNQPFDLEAILAKYLEYREQAPDADRDPVKGFKDGLGNWVLRTLEHARDFEPASLELARKRLYDEALALGFPGAV